MSVTDNRAKTVFLNALEISSSDERGQYIDNECGDNDELRREVERLLEHHGEAGSFLESPPPGMDDEAAPTVDHERNESVGTQIGPYKLREMIAEGGMGVVFVAEQEKPLKRKVALKVIKPGMDSKAVIARFEAERQALALMDHANIAKVLDAGTTGAGRPFFVMELVRGVPITEYCDQHRLTIPERLELFVQVCQAVQHAHQKAIIHRDIKPSNVLVTEQDGKAMPKVIDFGVAKALNQSLTDRTIYTSFQSIVGTPLYMSPEQAMLSAVDVDTRSDVYSLGVLLYELLTGATPFERERFEKAAVDEACRIVREEEPPKPSTKISSLGETANTVSQNRRTDPDKLGRSVSGDLDWIVMKTLEKDRSRRYSTANDVADDVERFLNNEPIEARPPSTWYRIRMTARRNKAMLASTLLISGALILGIAVATWQAAESRRSLRKVGEASMLLALQRALNGNEAATLEAVKAARHAGIDEDRIAVILAALDLYSGENRQARALAKLEGLSKTTDSAAAKALFLNAIVWSVEEGKLQQHYTGLEELKNLPTVNPEDRLFKGQAMLLLDIKQAIDLLEESVAETRSPVAYLLLAQALSHRAREHHDISAARRAYRLASAAHTLLPESTMARALHMEACHVAWRLDSGERAKWYLAECRRLSSEITRDSTPVERLTEAWFLADDPETPESESNYESMLERGLWVNRATANLLRQDPSSYEELVSGLEQEAETADADAQVHDALTVLHAFSPQHLTRLRQRTKSYDLSCQAIWPIDPRCNMLTAAILRSGRESVEVRGIVRHMKESSLETYYRPEGLYEFLQGDLTKNDFLNQQPSDAQRARAEFFVGICHAGDHQRERAILHLRRALETSAPFQPSEAWIATIHDLLESESPLVNWIDQPVSSP